MTSHKTIPLTRGFVTIVDDDVYEWAGKLNWYAWTNTSSGNTYAVRHTGSTAVLLHRVIMDAQKGEIVDHRLGITLDNRRSELRKATHAQNMRNRKVHPKKVGSTAKFKGVSWDRKQRKWKSTITVSGKTETVGVFDSEVEAAKAYDTRAIELSGEFAATNFIQGRLNPRVFMKTPGWQPLVGRRTFRQAVGKYGYRGVSRHGPSYRAVIKGGSTIVYSRVMPTAQLAALEYDKLAVMHYGQNAILNFPGLLGPS